MLDKLFKDEVISIAVEHTKELTCTFYRVDYESMLPNKWLRTATIDYLIKTLLHR